jgi:hypothetical protein
MANNLFISYDLTDPDNSFEKLSAEIQKLGDWAQVQPTLWFVKSQFTAEQVASLLWPSMNQTDDNLIVIDASNNTANWQNVGQDVAEFFTTNWNS